MISLSASGVSFFLLLVLCSAGSGFPSWARGTGEGGTELSSVSSRKLGGVEGGASSSGRILRRGGGPFSLRGAEGWFRSGLFCSEDCREVERGRMTDSERPNGKGKSKYFSW